MGPLEFTGTARRLGISSAVVIAFLSLPYACTLTAGLLSLQSPRQPIGDPFFWVLELLIVLTAPAMVVLMVAVHAWAPPEAKAYSLTALVFMSLMAGVTCSVHFVMLTVSRHIASPALPSLPVFLSFTWPSIPYALDILAWDLFYGLSALFAAAAFGGDKLGASIRVLLIVSGVLAIAGIGGVALGDMQFRMIGVVGYAVVFPVVAVLVGIVFRRTRPAAEPMREA